MTKFSLFLLMVVCSSIWKVYESQLNTPSSLPTEHQELLNDKYSEFMDQRKKEKEEQYRKQQAAMPQPKKGISPKKLGLTRNPDVSTVSLTEQVYFCIYIF
jgi:hypothetical protein